MQLFTNAAEHREYREWHIFINGRTGKKLSLRHFKKMIDKWARLLNIQGRQSIKPSGREYHPITLMRLREAERGTMICSGGDPDVSAKAGTARRRRRGITRKSYLRRLHLP